MIRKIITLLFLGIVFISSLNAQNMAPLSQPVTYFVKIETSKGDFTVALYDGTPQHRDNFLNWVRKGSYDGTLFHRIIDRFMIQGGNLQMRHTSQNIDVNADTLSLRIPKEIDLSRFYHKHGALCAAREDDSVNPNRDSSGSQFYIVTGNFYTDEDLDEIEKNKGITYSPEQRDSYKLYGGAPYLDQEYTVFGEVVEGIKVVEKIQLVETDDTNKPLKNISIERAYLVKRPK